MEGLKDSSDDLRAKIISCVGCFVYAKWVVGCHAVMSNLYQSASEARSWSWSCCRCKMTAPYLRRQVAAILYSSEDPANLKCSQFGSRG